VLGRGGYVFDAWVYHPQLPLLRDLARNAPETTIVVNHLGGPLRIGPYRRNEEAMLHWRRDIEQLGAQPNVVLKLGGIGMDHLFDLGWTSLEQPPNSMLVAQRWRDEIRACIEAFGPSRCMFESNYPVDRQSLPYSVIWNAFQIIAEVFDEADKDSLFRPTATRTYGISA
jgi:L-fuconolactonase